MSKSSESTLEYSPEDLVQSVQELKMLSQIAGNNDKQVFLKSILKNPLTQYLVITLLDSTVVLGLKKIQEVGTYKEVNEVSGSEVQALIALLATSNVTDMIRRTVYNVLSRMSQEVQEVIQGILCKTFKIGVTAKTVNKVHKGLIHEFSCMLAESGDIQEYPVAVGLKYDGVRCLAFVTNKVLLFTRQGKLIHLPKVEEELLKLAQGKYMVFDGELISDKRTSISGVINSIMKTGYTDVKGASVHYKVFDVVDYFVYTQKGKSRLQEQRLIDLSLMFFDKSFLSISEGIHTIANSYEEVYKIYLHYLEQGEEGIIAKDLKAPYEFKRSKAWLKIKAINSCTLRVIGTTEGTNDRKGKIGALVCVSEDSLVQVNVGSGLTDNDLNTLTPQGIVGKYVEVLFNVLIRGDSSSNYSLFLPRLKANDWLRLDKSEADDLQKILKEHKGKPLI